MTQGTPTGRLTFLDGGGTLGSVVADAAGGGSLTTATLTPGTHVLTAVYSGDGNFLPSTSSAVSQVISPAAGTPDFTLAAGGGGLQTVSAGATASFGLMVAVQNGPLNSPILLAASGVPAGFTASFSPALVPPGGAVADVTLSVKTVKTVAATGGMLPVGWLAVLVMLPLAGWRRRRGMLMCLVALGLCGVGGVRAAGDATDTEQRGAGQLPYGGDGNQHAGWWKYAAAYGGCDLDRAVKSAGANPTFLSFWLSGMVGRACDSSCFSAALRPPPR